MTARSAFGICSMGKAQFPLKTMHEVFGEKEKVEAQPQAEVRQSLLNKLLGMVRKDG